MEKNEEIETLDLSNETKKEINENLEGASEENIESKKKKSVLPFFIILIVLVIAILLGYGIYAWNNSNNESLKKTMEAPALDYFDKYMSVGTGASAYTVTLKELKEANAKNGENYKLNALDKCDNEKTQAIINIDYATGKVDKIEIKLNC